MDLLALKLLYRQLNAVKDQALSRSACVFHRLIYTFTFLFRDVDCHPRGFWFVFCHFFSYCVN